MGDGLTTHATRRREIPTGDGNSAGRKAARVSGPTSAAGGARPRSRIRSRPGDAIAAAEIGFAESSFETDDVQAVDRSIPGRALGHLGRDAGVLELLTRAVASQREPHGDEQPLTAKTDGYLVEFLDERGKTSTADRYRGLTAARRPANCNLCKPLGVTESHVPAGLRCNP